MRDRPAEPCRRSGLGVDMDELMILGRVGERIDAVLADLDPRRDADFRADAGPDLVEAGDGHAPLFAAM